MHNYLYAIRSIRRLSRILVREKHSYYYEKGGVSFMDKSKMVKLGLSVLGMALTIGSTFVNSKISDSKMEETIEEKVKEALNKQ